ncbi:hypothetical protein NPS70_09445 [Streptomyces sp. C10-9-1]|uniref:hypothetical protein n=1 Tax=Streptomyces sp. C10-9-1 TaxID=1859285 RepID=UPI002111C443|nr:hypothetical protein [Streptomyces sp. C10-9-1]MCQ6553417.1 hypothetical protein [Streptomyces sp. C10-9-1]
MFTDAPWAPESSPCCRTGLRPRRAFLNGICLSQPGGERTCPGPVNRRCIPTRYEKTSTVGLAGLERSAGKIRRVVDLRDAPGS